MNANSGDIERSGRCITLHLAKENMKFSAGHFTIFGPGDRERLHGHNFRVEAILVAAASDTGLCFDYGIYKRRIVELCNELDEWFILPARSPHLRIEESDEHLYAIFGQERIPFLRRDVLLLPIANATVEEFAAYLLQRLSDDRSMLSEHGIRSIEIRVSSGPGQSAAVSCVFVEDVLAGSRDATDSGNKGA